MGPILEKAPPREAPQDRRCRHRPGTCRELLAAVDIALTSPCKSRVPVNTARPLPEDPRRPLKSCMSRARACFHWRSSSVCSGRRRVRVTHRGLPAALVIRRSCSLRSPTPGSGASAAGSDGGKCAASCRARWVACVTPPAGPVQRRRGFGRGARTMTGLRADRLDRTLCEIESGRPSVARSSIRVADQSNVLDLQEGFYDSNPDKCPRPSAGRRCTSSCGAPASRCRGPTGGGGPSRRLAFQAATGSGVTRGNGRMTVSGEPRTSLAMS